jgi:hypothetical protein
VAGISVRRRPAAPRRACGRLFIECFRNSVCAWMYSVRSSWQRDQVAAKPSEPAKSRRAADAVANSRASRAQVPIKTEQTSQLRCPPETSAMPLFSHLGRDLYSRRTRGGGPSGPMTPANLALFGSNPVRRGRAGPRPGVLDLQMFPAIPSPSLFRIPALGHFKHYTPPGRHSK